MSAIHDAVLGVVEIALNKALITDIADDDDAKVGIVKQGPLQGDPDPDVARISVELYENDPDQLANGRGAGTWNDVVGMIEIGGCVTWRRRFTVKARCLLETTQEDLANARRIASTVRSRVEKALLKTDFGSCIADDGEFVTRGVTSEYIIGQMMQSGGPPDAYDIQIKVRFEVLTQNSEE